MVDLRSCWDAGRKLGSVDKNLASSAWLNPSFVLGKFPKFCLGLSKVAIVVVTPSIDVSQMEYTITENGRLSVPVGAH